MKAVALNYTRREVEERDVAEPQLTAADDVLLRILEIGICGTDRDLASFRICFPSHGSEYLVLGHECLAQVMKTGPAVTGLQPDDIVVTIVRRPCHPPCRWCAHGRRDLCETG